MSLDELRTSCAAKQKKGIHFILASVIIWCALLALHLSGLSTPAKNLYTFFCSTPLVPLAFIFSKVLKIDFTNKANPLNNLGVVFSINQYLYLLIAMWLFYANSETTHLLMVLAMIFGAHLLPYGWLYRSKTYIVLSVVVSVAALFVGINFEPYILAAMMVVIEIIFAICLKLEK